MNVVDIPVLYKRPAQITPREIWDAPEPSDLMVWEVCAYAKGVNQGLDEGCQQCPQWEEDEHHSLFTRGCRVWAAETCRVVMAVQAREGNVRKIGG